MDRRAWQAIVHGVARVGHDLATKAPPPPSSAPRECAVLVIVILPAMQETWVRSLGLKNPLEKARATHSSILGWRIPWTV